MAAGPKAARRRRVSYPVQNLRVEIAALHTAMDQVRERARKEAVHRLRTATRKVEAHLAVVAELAQQEPGFKAVENQTQRVKKLLDLVRKAAGRVRDLDVQGQLAKDCIADGATKKLHKEARELRGHLKQARSVAAEALGALLEGRGLKLKPRLETLMADLTPMASVGLSPVDQEVLTRNWYKAQLAEAARMRKREVQLHKIRLAAKLARYMAEAGLAARVVEEFKAVQEAGGLWHDSLGLHTAAQRWLGKRSGLAVLLKGREAAARSSFEGLIGR